ncbi:uncharacterized protein LOC110810429 [Carica papaya]|uniref:uncharacterized protein LOC110810429 n=1 Tax=Carica papaya TaxID=3649 RepID=UPI000B8CC84B|nr:uncharacterized protein LOC110810429 [Carica papaya]
MDLDYEFQVLVGHGETPIQIPPRPSISFQLYNVNRFCIDLGEETDAVADDEFSLVAFKTLSLNPTQSFTSHQVYYEISEILSDSGVPENINNAIVYDIWSKANSRPAVGSVVVAVAAVTWRVCRCDEAVEKVRWAPAPEENGGVNQEVCAVCMEEFVGGSDIRRTACFHLYHPMCIAKWLLINQSCPLCRVPILHSNYARSSSFTVTRI